MMKKEDFIRQMEDKLDFTFNGVDGIRREGLEDLKAFRRVKDNALKKESKRLAEKLGTGHPRVKEINTKIRYTGEMIKDLDVLITESNIAVELVDENTWKVHGKVIDKDRKGIQGLTAALYDEGDKWIGEMGYGCTNGQGYFSITYSSGEDARQTVSTDKELFLYILDKNHNILFKDDKPLFVNPGYIDYRTIYISDEDKVCTSPGAAPDGPGPAPGKDQWVVEGIVKGRGSAPAQGVTVHLFDKEHVCDKYLGTKLTDKNGKFKFIFKGENFQALIKAKTDIFLKVVDKKGKTVYTSPEAMRCRAGGVDSFDIQLPYKPKKK